MRALVTNDDGIDSEGIRRLALTAVGLGLDVVVAAPLTDASGTSSSLAAVQDEGRIVVEQRVLDELEGVPAYGVAAAPAFIAILAARGAFGAPPDVVLAGINRGLNAGHAVLHSGTVGAAFTGATFGWPGVAVSLDVGHGGSETYLHWETAGDIAAIVIPWVLGGRPGGEGGEPLVLNVNVPNVAGSEVRGLCRAALSGFGTVQANAETGDGFVQVTVSDREARHEPGTDAFLIAEGYATVTPLRPICEAPGVDLPIS